MESLSYHVMAEDGGLPVRRIALSRLGMSYGLFKRAKFAGAILLDGMPARADTKVQAGQLLEVRVPQGGTEHPTITPYAIPLTISYQDEHLLIVDKPAPLPSAPSRRQDAPTLENALYAALHCPQGFLYRPVNRLDKGTSGLMAVALSAHTQHRLQATLHTDAYLREYLAVCTGCPPQGEGVISQPIAKADGPTLRREVTAAGKPAVTHYRVLDMRGGRSLVQLRLETGRTHQIRVHMQWLGCPIVGDFLYGMESSALPGRFALHSHRLCLHHPITGESIDVQSPLPEALYHLLDGADSPAPV